MGRQVFEGIQYDIRQELFREGRSSSLPRVAAVIAVALLLWIVAKALLVGLVAVVLGVAVTLYGVMMLSASLRERAVDAFIPRVMFGVDKENEAVKKELLKDLRGRVLDCGAGDGINLKYLAPRAQSVVAIEPNRLLAERIRCRVVKDKLANVTVLTCALEDVHEPGSFDAIFFGNVLCEVPDVESTIDTAMSLLKPGGRIYFLEHVLASSWLGKAAQEIVNIWWSVVSGGCNCNRASGDILRRHPQVKELVEWRYNTGTIPHVMPKSVGILSKREH